MIRVFYDVLERKSVKLQNRVSGIVKIIDFTGDSSSKNVIEAIAYYRAKRWDY